MWRIVFTVRQKRYFCLLLGSTSDFGHSNEKRGEVSIGALSGDARGGTMQYRLELEVQ
jgi:hypothetical protein